MSESVKRTGGIAASPRLSGIPKYEPGLSVADALRRFGVANAVKLASNESPYPPLPEVVEAIASASDTLNRYPDGPAGALRHALADLHGVDHEQVVIGNGSCELILYAGQALLDPGTTLVHADPSFSLYPHLAGAAGAEALGLPLAADGGHDLESMAAAVDERTRLVILCNPNNPSGRYRSASEIEMFLDLVPDDVAVLVDEAYFDFVGAQDRGRVMSMACTRENLLVTRTFSKAHGLCGLRVGYGVGGRSWVEAIDRVRQPFNTNSLGQVAALEGLKRRKELERRVAETVRERERVAAGVALAGEPFIPSQANFILVGSSDGLSPGGDDGGSLHVALLRRGVIVRDGGALGCPGHIRVSIGTPTENDAFLAALPDALDEVGRTSQEDGGQP